MAGDGTVTADLAARWAAPPGTEEVGRRLRQVRERLAAAAGDRPAARIVAVTKGFGPEAVTTALANGLADVGENYAQELLAKARAVPAAGGLPRWHFLGAVQRRQVRHLAPLVALWHGVCRVEEGEAIAAVTPGAPVLVQVECTGLASRRGVSPTAVEALVGGLRRAGVAPVGLMTMGLPDDPEGTRAVFRQVASLAGALELAELSMGMSGDAELAVAEGATIVRLGRALFGERPPRFHPEDPPPQ